MEDPKGLNDDQMSFDVHGQLDCSDCRWWDMADGAFNIGRCRKGLPTFPDNPYESAIWPITRSNDWCGGGEIS